MNLDYESLKTLACVVRSGSFENAAQELSVTQSAVSQRIKQLEERMGTILVVRGRPCVASDDGQILCQHIEQVELLQNETLARLSGGVGQAAVKVRTAVNADSLATWFPKVIQRASDELGLLIEAVPDDQEFTQERLRSGDVLTIVTSSSSPIPGCEVHALGTMQYVAVASPSYMEKHLHNGPTLEGVSSAPSIRFDQKDSLPAQWINSIFGETANLTSHFVPSYEGHLECSLLGIGWAIMPKVSVSKLIDAGKLVELVPGSTVGIPLYWHTKSRSGETVARLTTIVQVVAETGLNET